MLIARDEPHRCNLFTSIGEDAANDHFNMDNRIDKLPVWHDEFRNGDAAFRACLSGDVQVAAAQCLSSPASQPVKCPCGHADSFECALIGIANWRFITVSRG
jgi:hypothetical protein